VFIFRATLICLPPLLGVAGAPNVPHYPKNKAVGMMKKGHVFTIEPMINEGSSFDTTWPDQWTSTTVDGKRSAQFEHTLLVTETGVEVLTARVGTDITSMPPWDAVNFKRPLEIASPVSSAIESPPPAGAGSSVAAQSSDSESSRPASAT
jgi:hypothetical protein